MPTNTKLLVAILVVVGIIGGVLAGLAAAGVFSSPERDSTCTWSDILGYESTSPNC